MRLANKASREDMAMGQGLRVIYEQAEPGMPTFNVFYGGGADLLPIALLCGLSVLLILLWLLVVWQYVRRANIRSSQHRSYWRLT